MTPADSRSFLSPDLAGHWCMRPVLAELIATPSRILHASWRAAVFPPAFGEAVWDCDGSHRHLSRHLIAVLQLPDVRSGDARHPAWDVAEMGQVTLEQLVRYVGAVAMGAAIRAVIDRHSLFKMVEAIGRDTYLFAVERGVLMWREPPDSALSSLPGDWTAESQIHVEEMGRRLIGRYLDARDPGLWPRVQLKLPYREPDAFRIPDGLPAEEAAVRIVEAVRRELGL